MVIIYNKVTKEIHHTEDNTMLPALPIGTFEEKKSILAQEGLDFVAIPYELGVYIYDYNLCFDTNDKFIGLQTKSN